MAAARMAAFIPRDEYMALPSRLQSFFSKFPPDYYSARVTGVKLPFTRADAKAARIAEVEALKLANEKSPGRLPAPQPIITVSPSQQLQALSPTDLVEEPIAAAAEVTAITEDIPSFDSAVTSTTTTLTAEQPIAETAATVAAADINLTSDAATPATEEIFTEAIIAPTPSDAASTAITSTPTTTAITQTARPHSLDARTVDGLSRATRWPSNPFLPFKNPATGRWLGPKYSLREQADLCKLARKHKIEDLLPPSRKSSAFRAARALEKGLRVRGTGEGQKVKGHLWERHMPAMLEKRRKALEEMPQLIREWQQRAHGNAWKKWPKAKTK